MLMVAVPENKGKFQGCSLVALPWAKAANVDLSDICKEYSGMKGVNAQYIS
jgi:hypothetical protein